MRWLYPVFILFSFFGIEATAWAADPSSASFQIQGSTFVPAVSEGSSASYTLTNGVEPFVGDSSSASWNVRHGAAVKDTINFVPAATPAATPTPGTGGGGGSAPAYFATSPTSTPTVTAPTTTLPIATVTTTVPLPTVIYRSPSFASHQVLTGVYDPTAVGVTVNGSTNGVTLLPGNAWRRDLPLVLGLNQIRVRAKDAAGNESQPVGGNLERMLIGDVNRDHRVNDVDLSLFTRAWKRYNVFADFNEDRKVNDVDLSLLASHWGLKY